MSAAARPIEFPVEGLTDGVVRLRLMADADVPAIFDACRDPVVQRYTTVPADYAEHHAREWASSSAETAGSGMGIELVVADAGTDDFVGSVGIRRHASDAGRWNIGYLVAPWARGRGIATRAVKLISGFAFEELGAERVEINAEPENTASRRVAERAGFAPEGVLRSYQEIKGVRRDMVMHSLLRQEHQG